MHLLRFFFTAWLGLGSVTVLALFWLCRRTAGAVDEPAKFRSFPSNYAKMQAPQ